VDTVRENTGWPVRFAAQVHETPAPTPDELAALRDLNARTAQAHSVTAAEARRGTGAPTGAERGHGAPASDGVGESEGRSPSDLVG
jgi:hypothetical protein